MPFFVLRPSIAGRGGRPIGQPNLRDEDAERFCASIPLRDWLAQLLSPPYPSREEAEHAARQQPAIYANEVEIIEADTPDQAFWKSPHTQAVVHLLEHHSRPGRTRAAAEEEVHETIRRWVRRWREEFAPEELTAEDWQEIEAARRDQADIGIDEGTSRHRVVSVAVASPERFDIAPEAFIASIRERWPSAAIHDSVEEIVGYLVEWTIADAVECSWSPEWKTVSIVGGSDREQAEIAIWYRQLVPAAYAVSFFDNMSWARVEVLPGQTPDQLVAAYRQKVAELTEQAPE